MLTKPNDFRYLSLCSGIGGFELAITRASHTSGQTNPVCLGYSEINKYAITIYKKHFNHPYLGRLEDIYSFPHQDIDLICAGFPCQPFSVAGRHGGFSDKRASVFFEITRIIEQVRPRFLLLENVPGLLSQERGETFTVVLSILDDLRYDLQWQVLNSKHFGVPQNRQRVFIIGHLRGTTRPDVFPITSPGQEPVGARVDEADQQATKPTRMSVNNPYHQHYRVYDTNAVSPTILSRRAPFIKTQSQVRKLTPVECERLQGFPDGWTEGISNIQRHMAIGNAVTVPVVEHIATKLITTALPP